MTKADLDRLDSLLVYKTFKCSPGVTSVEEYSNKTVTGIIIIREGFVSFEWYSEADFAVGSILFAKQKKLDLSVIHRICSSLCFTGKVYRDDISDDQINQLIRID